MNKAKWQDPMVPMTILGLKLCEEAGEVATELSDAFMGGVPSALHTVRAGELIEELDHVIFIAETMKGRVRRNGMAG